ncbi:aldolase [Violaceomyces palustris]|uniref:Aldolase n=1 Tax=Violaceomyces palustris TaxID=1673888 RepID=A0ACD0P4B2_9BASI|nr:aldolase [Violaceomyces palustris]
MSHTTLSTGHRDAKAQLRVASVRKTSHLSSEERFKLVAAGRKALESAGLNSTIIAGTGTGSLKETIVLSKDAARAGADACIVITPGYFSGAIARDRKALKEYFTEIADASPIPIMIYNFPACASGIDLDSDLLTEISEHPNIIGAKLTCAQIGKGLRLASSIKRQPFRVFPGFADIILPAMLSGQTGAIVGTGNLIPRVLLQLYQMISKAIETKDFQLLSEAQELQRKVAFADWALVKGGISGTKWALERFYESVGTTRRPLQPVSDDLKKVIEDGLKECLELERILEKRDGVKIARE